MGVWEILGLRKCFPSLCGISRRLVALRATLYDQLCAGFADASSSGAESARSYTAEAATLGPTRVPAGKLRRRFGAHGCEAVQDEPRPGSPRTVGEE